MDSSEAPSEHQIEWRTRLSLISASANGGSAASSSRRWMSGWSKPVHRNFRSMPIPRMLRGRH